MDRRQIAVLIKPESSFPTQHKCTVHGGEYSLGLSSADQESHRTTPLCFKYPSVRLVIATWPTVQTNTPIVLSLTAATPSWLYLDCFNLRQIILKGWVNSQRNMSSSSLRIFCVRSSYLATQGLKIRQTKSDVEQGCEDFVFCETDTAARKTLRHVTD